MPQTKSQPALIESAARCLRDGGVVAHATEGVWGLACDPRCQPAIQRILTLKGRTADKGLLLIAARAEEFSAQLMSHDPALAAEARRSWPGPHTWILPNTDYSDWVTGGRSSVGCRVPGHEQARMLCEAFGGPLVSTSANLSGAPALLSQTEVESAFAGLVDLVLPGQVDQPGQPSTIHGLDGVLLR